jgi:hypothetical protein
MNPYSIRLSKVLAGRTEFGTDWGLIIAYKLWLAFCYYRFHSDTNLMQNVCCTGVKREATEEPRCNILQPARLTVISAPNIRQS